ncbi:MAG: NUDIX hydrolase [Nocardioidaceae bacterium]
MSLHAEALAALAGWSAPDDEQRALQASYVDHLNANPDGVMRTCHPDHITASTLVVSPDRQQVLLNLHRRYHIWCQFGGHCEDEDESLRSAALREAVEESGIADLRLVSDQLVQLSCHEVRCGPQRPSHHLDVRYVAEAPASTPPRVSDESLEVRWFGCDEVPESVDAPLRALIRLAARV